MQTAAYTSTQSTQTQASSSSQNTQEAHDPNKLRTRCEVWTRVMGYHRPISHFNIGKKSEHISRKHFEECVAANCKFNQQY